MSNLHREIASDTHWHHPLAPELEKLPLLTQFRDGALPTRQLGFIASTYRQLQTAKYGLDVMPKAQGETLDFVAPNGLLKVVEDMRTYPKRQTAKREYKSHEVFDIEAQEMADELLYSGSMVGTTLDTPNGRVDIARRVLYYTYASSKKQLIGMESDRMAQGTVSILDASYRRLEEPLGSVHVYETKNDLVLSRTVSAQVLKSRGRSGQSSGVIVLDGADMSARV